MFRTSGTRRCSDWQPGRAGGSDPADDPLAEGSSETRIDSFAAFGTSVGRGLIRARERVTRTESPCRWVWKVIMTLPKDPAKGLSTSRRMQAEYPQKTGRERKRGTRCPSRFRWRTPRTRGMVIATSVHAIVRGSIARRAGPRLRPDTRNAPSAEQSADSQGRGRDPSVFFKADSPLRSNTSSGRIRGRSSLTFRANSLRIASSRRWSVRIRVALPATCNCTHTLRSCDRSFRISTRTSSFGYIPVSVGDDERRHLSEGDPLAPHRSTSKTLTPRGIGG